MRFPARGPEAPPRRSTRGVARDAGTAGGSARRRGLVCRQRADARRLFVVTAVPRVPQQVPGQVSLGAGPTRGVRQARGAMPAPREAMHTASSRQVPTTSAPCQMPSATPDTSCQVAPATPASSTAAAASSSPHPKNHDHHHDRDHGGHEHHGTERLQPVEVVDLDAFDIRPLQREPVARATRHDLLVDADIAADDLFGPRAITEKKAEPAAFANVQPMTLGRPDHQLSGTAGDSKGGRGGAIEERRGPASGHRDAQRRHQEPPRKPASLQQSHEASRRKRRTVTRDCHVRPGLHRTARLADVGELLVGPIAPHDGVAGLRTSLPGFQSRPTASARAAGQ